MFGALLRLSGLTANAAAYYLGVQRRDVINWVNEKSAPPPEMYKRVYELLDAQEEEVDRIIEGWEGAGRPPQLHYRVSPSDEAAQEAGWPSVASQMAAVAKAQAILTEVTIGFVAAEPEA